VAWPDFGKHERSELGERVALQACFIVGSTRHLPLASVLNPLRCIQPHCQRAERGFSESGSSFDAAFNGLNDRSEGDFVH
jgi:hypothetical protein